MNCPALCGAGGDAALRPPLHRRAIPYNKNQEVFDMDTCNVKILEIRGEKHSWFLDLLKDYEIPFRVELETYVEQTMRGPKLREKQCFYVPAAFESVLQDMIAQYYKPESIDWAEEEALEDDTADSIPQVVCPLCGEHYDFDYPRCPRCKGKGKR